MRVGIVGAGISGIASAVRLAERGINAVLFDKSRRPGGRMSTLRVDGMSWDFGAQYLAPCTTAFARQIDRWQRAGLLAPWPTGPAGALVGVPAMATLVERSWETLRVAAPVLIDRLRRAPDGWMLGASGTEAGPFDTVLLALPPEQTAPLIALHDFEMARRIVGSRSHPCWTVMAGFAEPLPDLPDCLQEHGPITWAARNSSKPGRPSGECWVIQAGPEWSQANLESSPEAIAPALLALFAQGCGRALPEPTFLKAHRWRYARSHSGPGQTLWNPQLGLGVCGDWCHAPDVEGAWLAGTALADQVTAQALSDAGALLLRTAV